MKRCKNCGAKLKKNDEYCEKCGQKTENAVQSNNEQPIGILEKNDFHQERKAGSSHYYNETVGDTAKKKKHTAGVIAIIVGVIGLFATFGNFGVMPLIISA